MGRALWVGAAVAFAAACGEEAPVTSDEPCPGGCPVEVHVCPAGGDAEGCGPRPPAIAWARSIVGAHPGGAWIVDVGSDASGRHHALSVGDYAGWSGDADGVVARLLLQTFEPSGALVGERQWDIRRDPGTFALAVAPGGDVYVVVSGSCSGVMYRTGRCAAHTIDFGAGPIVESGLVKLGPDGAVIWQKPLGAHSIATDAAGAVIVAGDARVSRLSPEGTVLWSRETGHSVERCAAAPGGDAVCALRVFSSDPPAFTTRIVRLAAAEGSTLWTKDVPELRFVHGVRASRSNVVVLGAPEAAFDSGEAQPALGEALLLAFAPDGSPVWARALEASPRLSYGGTGAAARLGGDANGRSAVAVADAACGSLVHVLEPDGASSTVPLVADGACSSGPFVTHLDVADDGAVLVGGTVYEDGVALGGAPLARGRFVAVIAPP